jgi:hypothetical protein
MAMPILYNTGNQVGAGVGVKTVTESDVLVPRDHLLVCTLTIRGEGELGATSIVFDGVAMTPYTEAETTWPTDIGCYVFYLENATTRTGDIVATCDAAAPDRIAIGWEIWSGHVRGDPFHGTPIVEVVHPQHVDADLDFTTTVPNCIIVHTGVNHSAAGGENTSAETLQWNVGLSASRGWEYYFEQAAAGTKTMTTSNVNPQEWAHVVFSIKGDPQYDNFDALTDVAYGPQNVINMFWSSSLRNLMTLGDSFTQANLQYYRMGAAIMRAWDHPAGWRGMHLPVSTAVDSYMAHWNVGVAPQTIANRQEQVAETIYNDTFMMGAPISGVYEWHVGGGTWDNSAQANRLLRADQLMIEHNDSGTYPTNTDDWLTGKGLTVQPIYMYHSGGGAHDGMVTEFTIRTRANGNTLIGTYNLVNDVDPRIGLEDGADAGKSGWNMLEVKVPLLTTVASDASMFMCSHDNWDAIADNRSFINAGWKLENSTGNLFNFVWAENSWETWSHAWEGIPAGDQAGKQFLDGDLTRWMDMMFQDKDEPLCVFQYLYCDGTEQDVNIYRTRVHDQCERYKAAWASVGGDSSQVYFLYVGGHLGTGGVGAGDAEEWTKQMHEGYWQAAHERTDTYYIGMYGLMGGILWTNSDQPAQANWAADHGWDNIVHRHGTIDISTTDCLDAQEVHQVDYDVSYAFAWILGEKIQELVSSGTGPKNLRTSPYAPRRTP